MKLYDEIEKIFPRMEKLLSEKDLTAFRNTSIPNLCAYHFDMGMWIRNNLLYPRESALRKLFIDNGIDDPDEMSSIIIRLFHFYVSRS